jgi:hypothetical protein
MKVLVNNALLWLALNAGVVLTSTTISGRRVADEQLAARGSSSGRAEGSSLTPASSRGDVMVGVNLVTPRFVAEVGSRASRGRSRAL